MYEVLRQNQRWSATESADQAALNVFHGLITA